MADNLTYRFIQNVEEYFPAGYFNDDFIKKVQEKAEVSTEQMKELSNPFVPLRALYTDYKNYIINGTPRPKDAIKRTHEWHTRLLKVLGYDTDHAFQEPCVMKEGTDKTPTEIVPVRHILRCGDRVEMYVMEMQNLIPIDECDPPGLFEQHYGDEDIRHQNYYQGQWSEVIPAEFIDRQRYKFSPKVVNQAISQIFDMPEGQKPRFILMLAGNTVFLLDRDKWGKGSYLQFSMDDLFSQTQISQYRNYFGLFYLLTSKMALCADGQTVLMDALIEDGYKKAYEVTKDLKEGVILAVETLANEALEYKRKNGLPFGHLNPETGQYEINDETFANEVKDDCLTIVYRLLFILFAESRSELNILPSRDQTYLRGYSFEALRDLEQVRLQSQESRDGYFFDETIKRLFHVLAHGHKQELQKDEECKTFRVRPIDSPMFDDSRLYHLGDVKIRNCKWQEIVRALSLSRNKAGQQRGRISYANLGINQLGSVYESLLAYRGFYAEEDYIEVFNPKDKDKGTFLVPYSRMEAFDIKEVVCDAEDAPVKLPKGTFVYRLNGRDRQKSASYYTPEVLTKSTIKYTIKAIVDDVRDGKRKPAELLDLKILEPAVGAAAFLNEVINQLAEAYMKYTPRKPQPDQYRNELQKVKAYIATHNVYGVDLNPTAIELGKLSLWLNVIHENMEPPFFANRLGHGNAVIGAWLKTFNQKEVVSKFDEKGRVEVQKKWWEAAPEKVSFYSKRVNRSVNSVYHFLLPDPSMLAVLKIPELKRQYPDQADKMNRILKDWKKALNAAEFSILQRLSAKIDLLLRDAYNDQWRIEQITQNRAEVWGMEGQQHFKQGEYLYAEKETAYHNRFKPSSAYYRLRLVMDYWCALWFWEFPDADQLPTRAAYWKDIEAILDLDDEELDARTQRSMKKNASLFPEYQHDQQLDFDAGYNDPEEMSFPDFG